MAISVLCPTCGRTVTGSDRIAGKVVTCPACRSEMQIPESVPPETAPQVQPDIELVPFDVDLVEAPSTPTPTRSADAKRGGIGIGIFIGLGSTVAVLLIGAVAVLAYLHFRGDGGAKQADDAKGASKKKSSPVVKTKDLAGKDTVAPMLNDEEKLMMRKLTATEDEAKQALKKTLDSWVLGDDFGTFMKKNPEILVFDTSWSIRDFILLRYEVIAVRVEEKRIPRPSNKSFSVPKYEIAVLQSFRSKAGTEIKDTRTYRVEKSLEGWHIRIKLDSPDPP